MTGGCLNTLSCEKLHFDLLLAHARISAIEQLLVKGSRLWLHYGMYPLLLTEWLVSAKVGFRD